jgi:hypothetical protein
MVRRHISGDLLVFTLFVCLFVLDCKCCSVVAVYVKDGSDGSVDTDPPSFPCTSPVKLKAGFGSNAKATGHTGPQHCMFPLRSSCVNFVM